MSNTSIEKWIKTLFIHTICQNVRNGTGDLKTDILVKKQLYLILWIRDKVESILKCTESFIFNKN